MKGNGPVPFCALFVHWLFGLRGGANACTVSVTVCDRMTPVLDRRGEKAAGVAPSVWFPLTSSVKHKNVRNCASIVTSVQS